MRHAIHTCARTAAARNKNARWSVGARTLQGLWWQAASAGHQAETAEPLLHGHCGGGGRSPLRPWLGLRIKSDRCVSDERPPGPCLRWHRKRDGGDAVEGHLHAIGLTRSTASAASVRTRRAGLAIGTPCTGFGANVRGGTSEKAFAEKRWPEKGETEGREPESR